MRWSYQTDSYRTALATRVASVGPGSVVLEDTVFHPRGGGQPGDRGELSGASARWTVVDSEERSGVVHHLLAPGGEAPPEGTELSVVIDWPRRYRFMRYHTALHLLSAVVFQRFGSGITGNQIAESGARMDFSIPGFAKPLAEELIHATNEVSARDLPVSVRFISAEEHARRPELTRVATEAPEPRAEARLIDIGGFDVQADGGTHVRSTVEVGPIRLDRIENKGARNKRLYIALEDREPPAVGPA